DCVKTKLLYPSDYDHELPEVITRRLLLEFLTFDEE
ncbi:hypothetical protein NPIL_237761, partial [Nephila pilipes]